MAKISTSTKLTTLLKLAVKASTGGGESTFVSGLIKNSEFSILLEKHIEFNKSIPKEECERIVKHVLLNLKVSDFNENTIQKKCTEEEKKYLLQENKQYIILTEISISKLIKIPKITVGETIVTFNPRLSKRFSDRVRILESSHLDLGYIVPNNYMPVSVKVTAKTSEEAVKKALYDIDLVRSIWSLPLNKGKTFRHTITGRPSPINDIRLSPLTTLHENSGELASDDYWYDSHYLKPAPLYSSGNHFLKILKLSKYIRNAIAQLIYKEDIELALVRYVRALDLTNLNESFLQLWSLLEYLTDSTNDTAKVTIRRAIFLLEEKERAHLVLSHLAEYRNRYVHTASDDNNNIESLLFLLKWHVDALLIFHIKNTFRFKSRKEIAAFLDLPTSKNEIDLQINMLKAARKFSD